MYVYTYMCVHVCVYLYVCVYLHMHTYMVLKHIVYIGGVFFYQEAFLPFFIKNKKVINLETGKKKSFCPILLLCWFY